MKSKVIMFDIDGVIADFVGSFTRLATGLGYLDKPFSTDEQESWDFEQIDRTNYKDLWKRVATSDTFWLGLQPLPDVSFAAINELQWGNDVYFVTNRPGIRTKVQTEVWLKRQGIESPTVIVSARKGEVAKSIGATLAIDDKAGNAAFIKYYTDNATDSYLIDRLYNQFPHKSLGSKVTRIKTVGEFLQACRA